MELGLLWELSQLNIPRYSTYIGQVKLSVSLTTYIYTSPNIQKKDNNDAY